MASVDLDIDLGDEEASNFEAESTPVPAQEEPKKAADSSDEVDIEFSAVNIELPAEITNNSAAAEASAEHSNVLPLTQAGGISERESEALVRAAVAEANAGYIAQHAGAAKVLEHQVNSWVNSMYKKNPALKKELLQLKKLVNDYAKPDNFSQTAKKKKAA